MIIQFLKRHISQAKKRRLIQFVDRLGAWPQRVLVGPARGLILIAPFFRGRTYCRGSYEAHILAMLSDTVKPGMIACDVGSHVGYFALALSQLVGPTGHVYAFEPLPRNVKNLQRSQSRNNLSQLTVVPQAVVDITSYVRLEEWGNETMSRIKQDDIVPWALREIEVSATTLDDWAKKTSLMDKINLIKLDIEGQELASLIGARTLIKTCHPTIICELHRGSDVTYTPTEVVNWLQENDYVVKLISSNPSHNNLMEAITRLEAIKPKHGVMHVIHILAVPA